MELRNCSVKHFIQTMRGGLVIKACNISSDGRPVTRTRTLKDIYDSEDAKRPHKPPPGSVFNNKQVKHKGPRFSVADRTLWKVKPEPDDDDSTLSAGADSDSDLDDATTLTQLKNRLLTKKRKCASTDEEVVEDESDLNEPIINLKLKHSKASRAKRRCLNPSVSSSATKVVIKSEENLVSEGSQQAGGELAPFIRVKAEVPDAEQLGSKNEMPMTSSAGHNEVLNPGEKTVLPENKREPLSNVNRYEECLTNEISYDHLEYVQPSFMLFPRDEVSIRLETPASDCEESLGSALEELAKQKEIPDTCSLVTSCSNDSNADEIPDSCHYSSSSVVEDKPEECSSGCEVPDMDIDGCITPSQGSSCVLFEDKVEVIFPSEDTRKEYSFGCQVHDLVINGCITPPEGSSRVLFEDKAEADLPSEDMREECSSGYEVHDLVINGCITPPEGSSCVLFEDIAEADLPSEDMHDECSSVYEVHDLVINGCITPPEGSSSVLFEDKAEADLPSEDMRDECSSGYEVHDLVSNGCITPPKGSSSVLFEDKTEADLSSEPNDSLSSPDKNYGSNQGSMTSSAKENSIFMKDTIADEEQLSTSSCDTVTRNDLNSEGHTEDETLKALDKQNPEFPVTSTENEYSFEDRTCGNADTISKPEQHQFPERLFSTRKAFSPSSEEQLCLAMNSVEIWDDSNQKIDSECKGKLFENQTEKKPSSLRSEVQCASKTVNHRLPGQVNQRKAVISTRRISKRQIAKGNLEGPRFSRTLPNLSTGCTSVQGCSESAVAFSQRQMHDMESVAVKLMNELKSMKDIVEQKLLFEAYRNASLKNDADEVKSAINNATRAEEMARKWMSMMARDCNRFCKIMKMTPDSTSSKDTLPKGERKIMFADEAGGKLCHVRLFYDSNASPAASNDVEQQGHQMQSGCLKASSYT